MTPERCPVCQRPKWTPANSSRGTCFPQSVECGHIGYERLRAEVEALREQLADCANGHKTLLELRESRLRAERERDEAREALREIAAYWEQDCEGCVSTDLIERAAALSSPAVTAEGKKLDEEGGGT